MAPQDHSLKSQLSDIQKRLSESTFNTPKRSNTLRRENDTSPGQSTTSPTQGHHPAPTETKSLSSLISRKEKRVSLPALDNSKALNSPAKGNGKDMNFVVGLSENLLQECRRLQAENQAKSQKLKVLEDDFIVLKSTNVGLMAKLNDNIQSEERYKDSNWELEMKMHQIAQELTTVTDSYHRTQKELAKQAEEAHEMRTELEEINMNRASLERDFSSNKVSSTNEIQDLKSHVDELNDENSRLNDEIDELRKKLDSSESKPKPVELRKIPVLMPAESSDDEADLHEPPASPVKTIPLGNDALQTETLKVSLHNAHQTIAKLRSQILKLRQSELSSKQSQHLSTPRKGQSPMSKKKGIPDSFARNIQILGSTNRGSTVIYDDSMASLEDDEWENYEGDTGSIISGSPSKQAQRPRSIISTASRDFIPESDSEFEDTTEYQAPLSSELNPITDEEANRYAQENGLVILPLDQYEKLSALEIKSTSQDAINSAAAFGLVALPNQDSTTKTISDKELQTHAASKGLELLPSDEKSAIVADLASSKEQVIYLTKELSQRELADAQYQKEAEEFRHKLDTALVEVKQKDQELIQLKDQIQKPSADYLAAAAAGKELCLVPTADYEALQEQVATLRQHFENPTNDFLHQRAAKNNFIMLPDSDHGALVAHIESLKKDVSTHVASKDELSAKIKSLQKNIDSHAASNSELLVSITALRDEIDTHVSSKQELSTHIESLERDASQHISAREDLNNKIGLLQRDITTHRSSNSQLTLEIDALKNIINEHVLSKGQLQDELRSVQEVHQKALVEHDNTVLSLKSGTAREIEALRSTIESPSITYITEKSAALGYTAVKKSVYDQTITDLTTSIKALEDEVAAKTSEIENPSLDYIKANAHHHGHRAIEVTSHEAELAKLNSSISDLEFKLTSLTEESTEKQAIAGQVGRDLKNKLVTLQSEHDELKNELVSSQQYIAHYKDKVDSLEREISTPSKDYLMKHATNQGFAVIPKATHVSLLEKSNRTVHDLASEYNFVLLSQDEHLALIEKANDPSIDHLRSMSEAKGHKLVPTVELISLQAKATRTLDDMAKENGSVVVPNQEWDSIQRKATAPTAEEVALASKSLGLSVLPISDHENLTMQALNPSLDHLIKKAQDLGFTTIEQSDLEKLRADRASLTQLLEKTASLESDMSILNDDIMKKDAYIEEITTALNEKERDLQREPILPKESLLRQAAALGLVTLTTSEHKALKAPSKESVAEHAKSHNHILISEDDHRELKDKASQTLDDLANEARMVVLSYDDHQSLLSPTQEDLEKHAKAKSLSLISDQYLKELKTKAERTVDDLADEAGMVVLSRDAHDELLMPSEETLAKNASALDSVLVSTSTLTNLQAKSSRTAADLAKDEDLVLLSHSEYDSLLNPSSDTLQFLCAKSHLAVIEDEKLKEMTSNLESPPLALLTAKADLLGMALVDKKRHFELVTQSSKTIEELATEQNLVVMTQEKQKDLTKPSFEKLQSYAKSMDHVVIPKEERAKLKDIDTVELADLSSRLKMLGHIAVSDSDYMRFTTEPTREDVMKWCQSHGIEPLERAHFENIQSPDYLSSRAVELGMVVVSRSDYDLLKAMADDPDKKTIEKHAEKLGYVVLGKNEHDALLNVSKKDLEAKAQKINHVLVPTAEYDELHHRMREASERLSLPAPTPSTPPSKFAATKDYFETVSRSAEKDSRKAKVFESAKSLGFVPVSAEEYKHLIEHQKEHVITKLDIYQKAKDFNLAVIPQDDYKSLLKSRQRDSMSLDDIQEYAENFGLKLISSDFTSGEKSIETGAKTFTMLNQPSTSTLSSAINDSDFTDALSRQPSNASTIHAADAVHGLTVDEIRLQASVLGYTIVPLGEARDISTAVPEMFYDESSAADNEDDETDEERHDTVVLDYPALSKETISAQAAELGLAVMDQADYYALTTSHLDRAQLEEHAQGLGLRIVAESDYLMLSEPHEERVRELGSKFGLVTLSTAEVKEIEENAVASAKPEDLITRENIESMGEKLDLKVLESSAYDDLVENSKPVVLSRESVVSRGAELGLVVLANDEHDDLKQKAAEGESLSIEEIALAASAVGMSVISANELSHLQAPKVFTVDELSQQAASHGLSVLPVTELDTLKKQATLAQDKDYIQKTLESNGIVSLSKNQYELLVEKSMDLSENDIVAKANELGLVTLPTEELANLVEKSKELSQDELVERIQAHGMVSISNDEHSALVQKSEDLTKDELLKRVESYGLISIPVEEHQILVKKSNEMSKDELLDRVKALGLVAVGADELQELNEKKPAPSVPLPVPVLMPTSSSTSPLTRETVIEKSAEFDLVAVPISEYKSLKMMSNPDSVLSKSDVVQKAMEYDLVAVSKEELEELRSKAHANRDTAETSMSRNSLLDSSAPELSSVDVESWARSHDMLIIPEDAFVATNVSRIPDPQNVVVLPVTYYNKLTKSETFNLDKVTNDELQAQVKKRGFHLSTNDHIGSHGLTRNNTLTSLSSSNSRKNIAEMASAAAASEYDQNSRVSRASSRGPSRSGSVQGGFTRDASADGGLSLITNASLSETNIIPALTQTVIGEYLFKYYRRLGPLSSISESRHERYFWIHPYTLTLYWSTTNPVLGDPSTHKTRAAAIIGVESIEDNNPLPAGLYHKSIVVHSQNRSIKFTCPTRQRHNIWYNSLRYLIQRSMDGIDLEEDLRLPVQSVHLRQ